MYLIELKSKHSESTDTKVHHETLEKRHKNDKYFDSRHAHELGRPFVNCFKA